MNTKRRSIARLFLLLFFMWIGTGEQIPEVDAQENVVLRFLGNAGWEVKLGKTIILIDPFLTRKDRVMDAEWKTDEAAVLKS